VRIYLIRNTMTGTGYIGRTVSPLQRRWTEHVSDANRRAKAPIQFAIRKYGPAAFTIELVAEASSHAELQALEIAWIKRLGTHVSRGGYNVSLGGGGGFGVPKSAETRAKISAAAKGRRRSPEASAKQAETMRRRGLSPEHKAKLHSPETILKRINSRRAKKGLPPQVAIGVRIPKPRAEPSINFQRSA